jgi:hypothetical protein
MVPIHHVFTLHCRYYLQPRIGHLENTGFWLMITMYVGGYQTFRVICCLCRLDKIRALSTLIIEASDSAPYSVTTYLLGEIFVFGCSAKFLTHLKPSTRINCVQLAATSINWEIFLFPSASLLPALMLKLLFGTHEVCLCAVSEAKNKQKLFI